MTIFPTVTEAVSDIAVCPVAVLVALTVILCCPLDTPLYSKPDSPVQNNKYF